MFKGISIYDFRLKFKTNEDCLQYLYDIKWNEGYYCRKCDCTKSYSGRTKWYRKCSECSYDESVQSGTLFHGMKLPLLKAFETLFMLSTRKKGMSILEIGKTYDINKNSAELLKSKAQLAMKSSGNHKLLRNVHVDEFAVGGKEKGKQGRSSTSKKTKIVLACEIVEHKGKMTLGNVYAQVIENYSTEQLRPIFNYKINTEASVLTDKWKSYLPINDTHDINQVISEGGKNFKELNILVMLFKGWLRGIHHHVSKKRMQCYIDEFMFRFNRKAFPESSFKSLISRFMKSKPYKIALREGHG